MAKRTPADDERDRKRALKIKNQQHPDLEHNAKGFSKGWEADPTVSKSQYKQLPNPDGFQIDWDEKHHIAGLDLYEKYTEGMTDAQRAIVDQKMADVGMYKGNNGLNRIDLPKRMHNSSKYPEYKGAHQTTFELGIDSKAEVKRLQSLSPDERFGEIDHFMKNQVAHRRVGQEKLMEQWTLEPGNNAYTNKFGGNFSQSVLQTRDKAATAKAGQALRIERKAMKSAQGLRKLGKGAGKAIKLPMVGGILAAGTVLAGGGSPAQAATAALDAENPLDGGEVADGTVTGMTRDRAERPERYGMKGPNLTSPAQSKRAAQLKKNPSQERGYETLGRAFKSGFNSLKDAAFKAFNTPN